MLEKIIEWSVHNRLLIIIAIIAVIIAGFSAIKSTPVDAIPDLSDVQVIIFTEYSGQGPSVVEDQVTYPLTTAMLAVPFAKVVRGYSFFGFSMVYIIFEDGTDIYWARSRVLEYLNFASSRLPQGVSPQLVLRLQAGGKGGGDPVRTPHRPDDGLPGVRLPGGAPDRTAEPVLSGQDAARPGGRAGGDPPALSRSGSGGG